MGTFHGTNTFTCTDETQADACVAYVHNALLSAGLVQTAVAGQLTSVAPWATTANSVFGFREYEMNDAASGAHPLYIRIYFAAVGQGNPGTAFASTSFVVYSAQVFFDKDGSGDPVTPLEMSASLPSASGTGPTAISCLLHIFKRDGLLVFIGGAVTTSNGGHRRLGSFIVRRSSSGVFFLFPPTRPLGTANAWSSIGYAHLAFGGLVLPTQTFINRPSAGTITPVGAAPRTVCPLVLANGTGVELLDDLVVTANNEYEHYGYIELTEGFSSPSAYYRVIAQATSTSFTSPHTPNTDSPHWVLDTADRYSTALAYRV